MKQRGTSIKALPRDLYEAAKDCRVLIRSDAGSDNVVAEVTGDARGAGPIIAAALADVARKYPGAVCHNVFVACMAVMDEIRDMEYETITEQELNKSLQQKEDNEHGSKRTTEKGS